MTRDLFLTLLLSVVAIVWAFGSRHRRRRRPPKLSDREYLRRHLIRLERNQ